MKHSSRTFSLVPSARTKGETTTPLSVLPAVPILLPEWNLNTLAIVDPSAALSCISPKLADSLNLLDKSERVVSINIAGEQIHVPMITTDLVIADPNFEPWLKIQRVSFAVTPTAQWVSDAAGVILGFGGCLEHLIVQFDFPKRTVSISAPNKFDLKTANQSDALESSRLREAELLLSMGSFDSAIVMAASGIEEAMRSTWNADPNEMHGFSLLRLRNSLPPELQTPLTRIRDARNNAVHAAPTARFTQEQTSQLIHDAWRIVRFVLSQNSSASAKVATPKIAEIYFLQGTSVRARAQYEENGMRVLAGSLASRIDSKSITNSVVDLRKRLVAQGILQIHDANLYQFAKDCHFESPSAAAAVVLGHSANGWRVWRNADGRTLDDTKRKPA